MTVRFVHCLLALAACDGVVDDSYRGGTRAVIQTMVRSAPINATEIAAFVAWERRYDRSSEDLRAATLPTNRWLSPARLEIDLHEPPPEELTQRGTVQGHIVVADLTRAFENPDGTFDISNALVGTSDEIDANHITTHTILVHQPVNVKRPAQRRGYNLVRVWGGITVYCTPEALKGCIDRLTSLEYSPEEIDRICWSPDQWYDGSSRIPETVPFDTVLPLTLTNGAMHVCPNSIRCYYRAEDLPKCQ